LRLESEVKAVCDTFKRDLLHLHPGVNYYQIGAHDHNLAATILQIKDDHEEQSFISGGGGKKKYDCGTGGIWTFCVKKPDGFVRQIINNTSGNSTFQLVDTSGKILFPLNPTKSNSTAVRSVSN
jgi:hypothetical protein